MRHATRALVVGTIAWAGASTTQGVLASAAWTAQSEAQAAPTPRIWQGIYSAEQAARGKATFSTTCVRCHGTDLGGTTAPPLTGDRFQTTFGREPVEKLFVKIRDTMPPNFGTVLNDQAKLDVATYILASNGYPAGAGELAVGSEDLLGAQVLRKGEQPVVQNFVLVQTVGCLARGPHGTWVLQRTAEPVATRDEAATPQALAAAASRPLGARTFRLLSAAPFDPEANEGRKMEARGLVYNEPTDARLSLTSLQTVASSCQNE